MRVKFSITNDDGTPALGAHSGEPHAFDLAMSPEVYAMIDSWVNRVSAPEGPRKYSNFGAIAREILFAHLMSMEPPNAMADIDEQIAALQAQKLARRAAWFGIGGL